MFEIFRQAAIAVDPGAEALDDPSTSDDFGAHGGVSEGGQGCAAGANTMTLGIFRTYPLFDECRDSGRNSNNCLV